MEALSETPLLGPQLRTKEPAVPGETRPRRPMLDTRTSGVYVGLSEHTLEKLRCIGGGPPYYKLGRKRVVYDPADLDDWMRSKRCTSTSSANSLTNQPAPARNDPAWPEKHANHVGGLEGG